MKKKEKNMLTQYAGVKVVSFNLSSILEKEEQIDTGGLFGNKTIMMLIEKHFKTFTGQDLISSKVKDVQVFKKDLKYIGIKDYIVISDFSTKASKEDEIMTIEKINHYFTDQIKKDNHEVYKNN